MSDEQLTVTEKTLEDYLIYLLNRLQENGKIKITPIENTSLKYELEILDNSLEKKLEPRKPLKPKTVIFAQIIFKSQIFRLRLKGIENPIDIKFKKRKNGYSAIVCELYRALKQRKNKYTEEIERQLKEELAVGLEKENKAKNIGDQLSKFLKQVGGKTMRDLLFDATSSSLKYKKIVKIKDLKKAKVKSLTLKGIRYDFDFEQNIWVEHNAD